MTRTNTGTIARVTEFLSRELGVPQDDLTPTTTLREELRVDGTDAVDLMFAFGQDFGVDMSSCDLRRYFGPEG